MSGGCYTAGCGVVPGRFAGGAADGEMLQMQDRLSRKVALVTGAGGRNGIGRAIALRLAQDGADVAVNDLVERPRAGAAWAGLPALVAEIETMGRRAFAVAADVSDATSVDGMLARVLERFGQVDILVTNAGTPAGRDRVAIVDLEESEWDRVQAVNVKGAFLCCRAVARSMLERGAGGRIITMSSMSGKTGAARFGAYCASKFAVIGLTQALAHELGPHGITVNAICPGVIDTERYDDIADAMRPEGASAAEHKAKIFEAVSKGIPVRRVGRPADVAALAAFLAGADADYITGMAIPVTGGMYMA